MNIDELKQKQKEAWDKFKTCRDSNGNPVDKKKAWDEHKRITTEIYNLEHPESKI